MPSVADILREMAPDWSANDTRRATRYVHDLLDRINTWDESNVRSQLKELKKEDNVFAAVVWSMLPPPLRHYLSALDEIERRTNREADAVPEGDSQSIRKSEG